MYYHIIAQEIILIKLLEFQNKIIALECSFKLLNICGLAGPMILGPTFTVRVAIATTCVATQDKQTDPPMHSFDNEFMVAGHRCPLRHCVSEIHTYKSGIMNSLTGSSLNVKH